MEKKYYGAFGKLITNSIEYADGRTIDEILGGTIYGLEGIRLWTDDCYMITKVGNDFDDYYGQWYQQNNISRWGVHQNGKEHCLYTTVKYNPDGTYEEYSKWEGQSFDDETYAPTVQDLAQYVQNTKACYFDADPDPEFFKEVAKLQEQSPFKIMWEIKTRGCQPQYLDAVKEILKGVEMFSINMPEAKTLFGTDNEEECIRLVQQLPAQFTLLRAGERGLYTVTPQRVVFIPIRRYNGPVQDPTGCGNSSTTGAMWAWCEGYDDVMTGLIANTTAYYNVQQYGPIQKFDPTMREKELAYLKEERNKYPK